LMDVPKPFLTGGPEKAKKTASQPKDVNLTLVIIGSE